MSVPDAPDESRNANASATHLIGPVALGVAIGFLTGMSRNDSTVLAAVLPAVLAAAGGLLFAFRTRRSPAKPDPTHVARDTRGASLVIAVFSVALLLTAIGGNWFMLERDKRAALDIIARHGEALAKSNEAIEEFRRKHFDYLGTCSTKQFQINKERKSLALEPVTLQHVCPDLASHSLFQPAGAIGVGFPGTVPPATTSIPSQ